MTEDTCILTPELLRRAGEALFGPEWIGPLAADQAMAPREMQRWAAGTREPPFGLASELIDLCQFRAEMFRKMAVSYAARAQAMDEAARDIARHVAKLADAHP